MNDHKENCRYHEYFGSIAKDNSYDVLVIKEKEISWFLHGSGMILDIIFCPCCGIEIRKD